MKISENCSKRAHGSQVLILIWKLCYQIGMCEIHLLCNVEVCPLASETDQYQVHILFYQYLQYLYKNSEAGHCFSFRDSASADFSRQITVKQNSVSVVACRRIRYQLTAESNIRSSRLQYQYQQWLSSSSKLLCSLIITCLLYTSPSPRDS